MYPLVFRTDTVFLMAGSIIHVDVESDSLSSAFLSLLDSAGFSQRVSEPTRRLSQILDLL